MNSGAAPAPHYIHALRPTYASFCLLFGFFFWSRPWDRQDGIPSAQVRNTFCSPHSSEVMARMSGEQYADTCGITAPLVYMLR